MKYYHKRKKKKLFKLHTRIRKCISDRARAQLNLFAVQHTHTYIWLIYVFFSLSDDDGGTLVEGDRRAASYARCCADVSVSASDHRQNDRVWGAHARDV